MTVDDDANEATVELRLVLPLLHSLGYNIADIASKHPIRIQDGRASTVKYADFVVFDGPVHVEDNALFVVEAKRPGEPLEPARRQAESYALRARALVFVVTDGRTLEVWQYRRTGKSELVLACEVKHVAASRAPLEACLGREVLKAYRASIREPSIKAIAIDLSAYEDAEIDRLAGAGAAISRTLLTTEFPSEGSKPTHTDSSISFGPMTVIFGSSGMGKSRVCALLNQQALLQRRLFSDRPVPVAIYLPDVAVTPGGIRQFAFARIAAHCPHFKSSIFDEMLRTSGLDLFCDAFDRVQSGGRETLERDMRLLLRDSPATRLTIFSRQSAAPQIDADVFFLQPLNRSQQDALEEAVWPASETSTSGPRRMPIMSLLLPDFLRRLAGSPLVFARLVLFYAKHQKLPTDLAELFDFWLGETLRRREHKPTAYSMLVDAATVIALETWDGAAKASAIMKALATQAIPSASLDTLVELGTVIESDGRFEVEHEALADFLRAQSIVHRPGWNPTTDIPANRLDSDAFFPVLLAALTTDLEQQRTLLTRLTVLGFDGYLNAVRFRGNAFRQLAHHASGAIESHFAREMVDSFMATASRFFPHLLPDLIGTSTGSRSTNLQARVEMPPKRTTVGFALYCDDAPPDQNDTLIGGREDFGSQGREIGLYVLQRALGQLIERSCLTGGPVWHQERLLGRLRVLLIAGTGIETSLDFRKQRQYWNQYKGEIFVCSLFNRHYEIAVDDMLADLDVLEGAGGTEAAVWWNPDNGNSWWLRDWDESDEALRQYIMRIDAAYAEVVASNFTEVAGTLSTNLVLPRAWDVYFQPRHDGRRNWVTAIWHPVERCADVNVKVFRGPAPKELTRFDSAWFDETTAKLRSLNRRFHTIAYHSGAVPSFSGRAPTGRHDGKTAVLREVCQRLQTELLDQLRAVTGIPSED
ncbi:type I restriction enzyme HsdR N-terminal domain-containing protein [Paraburkholderia caribensis]|nr:type I restriction enzyme HsdR N-terminal domain-containing protein [Paraburkholderia caribensis]